MIAARERTRSGAVLARAAVECGSKAREGWSDEGKNLREKVRFVTARQQRYGQGIVKVRPKRA